jgi:hypothetical protein
VIVPEDARAHLATVVSREIGPSVAVHIVLGLPMTAGQERRTPTWG